MDTNKTFKFESVLKRILATDVQLIESKHKDRLLTLIFDLDFLAQQNDWYFKRIRKLYNNDTQFFGKLDSLVDLVLFNSYHYNLLRFYRKERPDYDCKKITDKINELKLH